jgi:hypothetical protein
VGHRCSVSELDGETETTRLVACCHRLFPVSCFLLPRRCLLLRLGGGIISRVDFAMSVVVASCRFSITQYDLLVGPENVLPRAHLRGPIYPFRRFLKQHLSSPNTVHRGVFQIYSRFTFVLPSFYPYNLRSKENAYPPERERQGLVTGLFKPSCFRSMDTLSECTIDESRPWVASARTFLG